MNQPEYNVASLVSGGGSTYKFLATEMKAGRIPMNMSLLLADKDCDAIGKAKELGTPSTVVYRESFRSGGKINQVAFGEAINTKFIQHKINVVLQNGWTPWTPKNVVNFEPPAEENEEGDEKKKRILKANQHPGHPVDFGGKGMASSDIVQTAVIKFQELVGRQVEAYVIAQRLDEKLDGGAVFEYDGVTVKAGMTPDELKKLLLPLEYEVQKRMLLAHADGTLTERVVPPVVRPGEEEALQEARAYAIEHVKH